MRNTAQFDVHGSLGGFGWKYSGETFNGLYDDTVTVKFKNIAGWTTPLDKRVTLIKGTTNNITATYSEIQNTYSDLVVQQFQPLLKI